MQQLIHYIPFELFGSAYGCGSYGSGTYNNSCTTTSGSGGSTSSGSSSSSGSGTGSSSSSTTTKLTVSQVDTGTAFVASGIETVSIEPTLAGTAPPNSTIVITIDSGLATCTTKTNSSGHWSCTFSEALPVGDHTVSVVATTPAGKVIKFPAFKIHVNQSTTPTTVQQPQTTTPAAKNGISGGEIIGLIIAGAVILGLITWFIAAAKRRRRGKRPPQNPGTTISPSA